MALVGAAAQAVLQELKRVLDSSVFARNERLSRFLRFIVERRLEGRDHELKESVIGNQIFGRRPDYDPKSDAIVRTEARRLRALLNEYYLGDGKANPLVIDLPKGGYAPVFRGLKPSRRATRVSLVVFLAASAIVAAVTVTGWWWVHHKNAPIPIAVLPLINLSQDPANSYFADGLTSEIIRNLSIIDGLAVRSQTSSFAFRDKSQKAGDVGRQLAAEYLVEGSVLRSGKQLRIDAQLVRVRDDFPLWSGRYDRELTDIFTIQDEISPGIVNGLRLKLGRGRRRYETSADVYEFYLRARSLQLQSGVPSNSESIGLFEKAVAMDPSFAPAYGGLATAYEWRSGAFGSNRNDELTKMKAAAEKAIQVDPLLAEAHEAMGAAYAEHAQWEQSERSFRRAIELDPNRATSYTHFARDLLMVIGRVEEALNQMRLAEKADPRSPEVHFFSAWMLLSLGRYDQAAGYCQQLPAAYRYKPWCLGRARLGQERVAEAIQILDGNEGGGGRGSLGYAYGRAGRRNDAEKLAASSLNPFYQALTFAGLGDKDRTFEALERMSALGAVRIGKVLTFPEFALLRGDPRVKALRKRVGLPE